ncbi:protein of unknown function UPF0079 [Magnetococcus marinus MC-1]|uniref:tRNA threonylcarbamoyladenosine biosynthesis protein TsaE n=1 Tax=Magnetococcus marinus (strain ATCC BAA-1437 / JCM 17883 / MC-1) TaxID=156889 RepID=A0L686_MAGMM|nr:tRNA (adenosine(37)-N6)-threonylcarbamoyltransferase complex ATPase subunit type 1 TsaE [Magnetococcus marinus]ABK43479.1 protein of unknown function UPF0079 [Magnetococcus marinus MC-1]
MAATLVLESHSEAQTEALAAALAGMVDAPLVIALSGDLGAGKTAFSRGFVQAMLGERVVVSSPTFAIMQSYVGGAWPVYHFDLYRLAGPEELEAIGADEALFEPDGVALVEWASLAGDWLPQDRLDVMLEITADGLGRRVLFRAAGLVTTQLLHRFRQEYHAG